jgi:RNA polymerase sigma factor for flagellar operon FliA
MEPRELERRWLQFRASLDPALREQLIVQYAPLVKYVIGRTPVSLPGLLSSEDILSYGTIGLIQAVDRFDPTQGVKFETYAIRRIRGSIIAAIRSFQPVSRETTRRAREVEQGCDALTQQLGRAPTDEELADHLGVTVHDLQALLLESSVTTVSLDAPLGEAVEGESLSLVDQLADPAAPGIEHELERQQLYQDLVQAIEQLPERDRLVITLYYYEELSLKEIGAVLEVSVSRVSQLHAAAVFRLRALLRGVRAAPLRERRGAGVVA